MEAKFGGYSLVTVQKKVYGMLLQNYAKVVFSFE